MRGKTAKLALNWIRRKVRKRLGITRNYQIGRFELTLSPDHRVDEYQKADRLTDTALGEIARIVVRKYPDLTAVDIGANVGDTAALICRYLDVPVLCVEGHPEFTVLLKKNLQHLPSNIEVAECLVGAPAGEIEIERLQRDAGTAALKSVAPGNTSGRTIRIRPLSDILRDHPRFARPRLIKIDTDGSDYDILLSSADVIADVHPILFFEYLVDLRRDGLRQSIESIIRLQQLGYDHFLVYDNFGNFVQLLETEITERFRDINRYLMSQRFFGQTIIYYYDICAFVSADSDLAFELKSFHQAQIEGCIRDAGLEM
jgi:FkbM family methyltransferase